MSTYAVKSGDVTGAANKTLLAVLGTATRRPKLVQLIIGCSGTPGDEAAKFELGLLSADGTGTAANLVATDGSEGVATLTAKKDYSAEPSYSGDGIEIALNQRGTLAMPFGFLFAPAIGVGKGIGLKMVTGPAKAYNVTFIVEE